MTKTEAAEKAKEFIEQSSDEVQKVQVIVLGGGGWIDTNSWEIDNER